jgi:hypothetical protein
VLAKKQIERGEKITQIIKRFCNFLLKKIINLEHLASLLSIFKIPSYSVTPNPSAFYTIDLLGMQTNKSTFNGLFICNFKL